jgi:hypothetical protein
MLPRCFTPETVTFRLMRRLRYLLSRLFGNRLQNSQQTAFETLNGQRFKRLILRDTALATELERNLEAFQGSGHFSSVAIRYEHELWLEYVEGIPITQVDASAVEKIADFYAVTYTRSSQCVNVIDTPFLYRLQRDLRVLNQVGVLTDDIYHDLDIAAERLAPERVWVGYDYIDAVLKNFVVTGNTENDGVVCGIDVDSLRKDQLIGTGVANALARWLEPFQDAFFQRLFRDGVPDFRPYLLFIELCYVSAWTKMYFFEKKWKRVDPRLFERFLKK